MKLNVKRVYTFIFLLLPVLNIYIVSPVKFLYIWGIMGFFIIATNYKDQKSIKVDFTFVLYIGYIIVNSMLAYYETPDIGPVAIANRMIRMLVLMVNFCIIGYRLLDSEYMYKCYRIICEILSILIVLQFLMSMFGNPISLIIPNITIEGDISTNTYISQQISQNRFSTFFLEPAHLAQYEIPCLGILLFGSFCDHKKLNVRAAIFITIGLFATTSMQGILGSVIIWGIYFLLLLKTKNPKRLLQIIGICILLLIIGIYAINQPIILEQIYKKVNSLSKSGLIRGTSTYLRIMVGWDCYGALDIFHKIFGVGYLNTKEYLISSGMSGKYYSDTTVIGYMNGMSKMFFDIGVLGSFIYCSFLYRSIKKYSDDLVFGLIICILIIATTCDCYEQIVFYYPIMIVLNRIYNNKRQKEN